MEIKFLEPLYKTLNEMWLGFVGILPMLLVAVVLLIITGLLAKTLTNVLAASLSKSHIRPSLKALFSTLLKVLIWMLGIIVAAVVIFPSLTPAKMLTALGLGSVAIGLAFKDIFENFFAGILIMSRKPMRIGDFIECEGVSGKVEKIAIRETYLRKTDDQLVIVPNSFIFKNPVYIRTDKNKRRFDIIVGVAYGENLSKAQGVITQALNGLDYVDQSKSVEVYAREFNSSSVDFTVRWWGQSTPLDMHKSRNQVVIAIKAALDDAGIEIPFPYRTLTFKEPLSLAEPSENNG